MGKCYSIYFENQTISAATILAAVRPSADRSVKLVRAWIGQNGTATSKNLDVAIGTKASAYPTLTSFTPKVLNELDPASSVVGGTALAAGTCGIMASAEGAGTFTPLISECMNNLNGYLWIPGPKEIILLKAGSALGLCLRMNEAPGGSYQSGWYGGLIFEED